MDPKMTVSAVSGQIPANSTNATMMTEVPRNTGQLTGEWERLAAPEAGTDPPSSPPGSLRVPGESAGRGVLTASAITVLSVGDNGHHAARALGHGSGIGIGARRGSRRSQPVNDHKVHGCAEPADTGQW